MFSLVSLPHHGINNNNANVHQSQLNQLNQSDINHQFDTLSDINIPSWMNDLDEEDESKLSLLSNLDYQCQVGPELTKDSSNVSSYPSTSSLFDVPVIHDCISFEDEEENENNDNNGNNCHTNNNGNANDDLDDNIISVKKEEEEEEDAKINSNNNKNNNNNNNNNNNITNSPDSCISPYLITSPKFENSNMASKIASGSNDRPVNTRSKGRKTSTTSINSDSSIGSNSSSSGRIKKPMSMTQRKAHNKIERKYRININSKIANLQKLVPWMSEEGVAFEIDCETEVNGKKIVKNDSKKLNKSMILDMVTKYLMHLKDDNDKKSQEIAKLRLQLNQA